jgi:membrane associated rhomboid family serine protease
MSKDLFMSKMNGHDPENNKENIVHFSDQVKPPLQKSEPIINLPPATKVACLALLGIGVAQNLLPDSTNLFLVLNFGFVPEKFPQKLYPLMTHMFLHAGWLHLGMNVLMLAAFGAGLEKMIGRQKTQIIFLLSGISGAITHFIFYHDSFQPMIGASGAISGLFGALAYLMTRESMLQGNKNTLLVFVAIWVFTSLFFGFFGMPGAQGPIAWTTHVGFVLIIKKYRGDF